MAKKVESSMKRKLSALVVDDDPVGRMILVAMLRRHDFETCSAENGREAVDLIRSGRQFDVIFMDVVMPVMNGIQVGQVFIIYLSIYMYKDSRRVKEYSIIMFIITKIYNFISGY